MRADFTILFDAPEDAHATLRQIGRTEDASFSPDNRRLALVCLDRHTIAIADIDITADGAPPRVWVTGITEFSHSSFKTPHGIDFIDDDRILVANRYGRLLAFRLPIRGAAGAADQLVPIEVPAAHGFEHLGGPGSVRVLRDRPGALEVLICNNRRGTITRHEVRAETLEVTRNDVLLSRLLDFPDSVSVTGDHEWIAISNHHAHVVMLYRWTSSLSEKSEPDCVLRGTMYPHGLRFSADGRHLIVADAGRPHVNVYARRGDDWRGVRYPNASVRVMSDEIYSLSRDRDSRGPKGINIDNTGRVLVVTYEKQPIVFFDLVSMLEGCAQTDPDQAMQLGYEVETLHEGRARLEERTAALMSSTSFRITKPLRVLNAAFTKKRR